MRAFPTQEGDSKVKQLSHHLWIKGTQLFLETLLGIDSLSLIDEREILIKDVGSLLTEHDLQKVALSVLSKLRLKFLDPYLPSLLKMTEKVGVKHALIHFQLTVDGGSIAAGDREQLIPVITRLLFPSIATKKKRRGDAVLSYLSSAEPDDLLTTIELCFRPWGHLLQQQAHDQERLSRSLRCDMFDHPWWSSFLQKSSLEFWMQRVKLDLATAVDRAKLLHMGMDIKMKHIYQHALLSI